MFSKIRNRLTFHYAIVMVLLMVAFIVVSSTGLLWVIYREEQQDLRSLTEEEAREQAAMYKERAVFFRSELEAEDNVSNNGAKIFYYVFDTNGQQVAVEEPAREMRTGVLSIIQNWHAQDGEAKLRKFYLPNGERAAVMMCSTKIYDGSRVIGTVFVGEDITSYYQRLKMLLVVVVMVSLLFLFIAAFAGHLLAGRAIVPIKQAFFRQRGVVADASHELRTPLCILLTSVDAVQTDDDQNLSPFSTQVLDDMKSEIRRMSKLVSDLLTLARADTGVTNLMKEKFDLDIIAERVIRSLQPLAVEKGIKLQMTGATNVSVLADRERMNQLLLILVDNAIKYTPSGGGVGVLLTTAADPKPCVTVTVQDTGVGIPETHRNLIFERFYRVDKARSREEGGTGLGLAIAKWIVEAHGGTIKVESTSGVGSSFIVTLPM